MSCLQRKSVQQVLRQVDHVQVVRHLQPVLRLRIHPYEDFRKNRPVRLPQNRNLGSGKRQVLRTRNLSVADNFCGHIPIPRKVTFIETDGHIHRKVTVALWNGRFEQNNCRARLFDGIRLSKSWDSCLESFALIGEKVRIYGYFAQTAIHTGLVTKFQ